MIGRHWSKARLEALAELILHRAPLTLAALLLLGAIAINFTNVVARYIFLASIYWADEAMVYLVIWSIFLAAIAVTYDGSHLTMDLFSARISARWQRALDRARHSDRLRALGPPGRLRVLGSGGGGTRGVRSPHRQADVAGRRHLGDLARTAKGVA